MTQVKKAKPGYSRVVPSYAQDKGTLSRPTTQYNEPLLVTMNRIKCIVCDSLYQTTSF